METKNIVLMIYRALANFPCIQVGCGCVDVLVFGYDLGSAKDEGTERSQGY